MLSRIFVQQFSVSQLNFLLDHIYFLMVMLLFYLCVYITVYPLLGFFFFIILWLCCILQGYPSLGFFFIIWWLCCILQGYPLLWFFLHRLMVMLYITVYHWFFSSSSYGYAVYYRVTLYWIFSSSSDGYPVYYSLSFTVFLLHHLMVMLYITGLPFTGFFLHHLMVLLYITVYPSLGFFFIIWWLCCILQGYHYLCLFFHHLMVLLYITVYHCFFSSSSDGYAVYYRVTLYCDFFFIILWFYCILQLILHWAFSSSSYGYAVYYRVTLHWVFSSSSDGYSVYYWVTLHWVFSSSSDGYSVYYWVTILFAYFFIISDSCVSHVLPNSAVHSMSMYSLVIGNITFSAVPVSELGKQYEHCSPDRGDPQLIAGRSDWCCWVLEVLALLLGRTVCTGIFTQTTTDGVSRTYRLGPFTVCLVECCVEYSSDMWRVEDLMSGVSETIGQWATANCVSWYWYVLRR